MPRSPRRSSPRATSSRRSTTPHSWRLRAANTSRWATCSPRGRCNVQTEHQRAKVEAADAMPPQALDDHEPSELQQQSLREIEHAYGGSVAAPVQRKTDPFVDQSLAEIDANFAPEHPTEGAIHHVARAGVEGPARALPHRETIQHAFG